MRKLLIPILLSVTLMTSCQPASTPDTVSSAAVPDLPTTDIEAAVDALNDGLVEGNREILERYTDEQLSYGHSAGLIENKNDFVENLVSGKHNFLDADVSEKSVHMLDERNAVVEHVFSANTHDLGKDPGQVKLKVLQVWHKATDGWRLVARQAVRI